MDERMMYDGRRLPPRNSRGEFMSRGRGRGRRGDRGMGYEDMRGDMRMRDGRVIRSYPRMDYGDMNYDMARGGRGQGGGRSRGDYSDYRGEDMRRGDMRGGDYAMDGHYPQGQGATYYPIQAMGTFEGYYGMPEQDYGRGRRDYGYDYGYDDYGDYGETLSEKELEEWCHKLKSKLDEREKQMFSKEMISQKAKQMGKEMKGFGEKELEVVCLMLYDDYKPSVGQNPDLIIKLAFDWLNDQDAAVKGAEKLAMYKDYIVDGGED